MVKTPPSGAEPRTRSLLLSRLCRGVCRIVVPLALALLLTRPGLAQEEARDAGRVDGGVETFCYSRYLSRGIASSEGPVFQPTAWVTLEDFTLTLFGNYVLTREKQQGRFNEADLSLVWGRQWNGFTIEPKFTLYAYPNTTDQTQHEVGITVGYDLGDWRLSTFHSVTVARSEKGYYYGELAMEYRRDFSERLSLAAELAVSWPVPTAALGFEGKLSYRLTKAWSLSLHAGCSIARSDAAVSDNHAADVEDSLPQGRNGFVGIGLGFAF